AEIYRLACVFGNEAPFHAGRKTSAAAAAKPCGFSGFDNVFRRQFPDYFFGGLVSAEFHVAIDFFYTGVGDFLEQYKFVRHNRRLYPNKTSSSAQDLRRLQRKKPDRAEFGRKAATPGGVVRVH